MKMKYKKSILYDNNILLLLLIVILYTYKNELFKKYIIRQE